MWSSSSLRSLLLASLLFSLSTFAMGNAAPVVDLVSFSSTPQAGGTVVITCAAHDPDGTVMSMQLQVSGGTLPQGGTTQSVAVAPAASVTGSLAWSVPAAGAWVVTCTVNDNGGIFGGSAVGTLAQPVVVAPASGSVPVIDALLVPQATVRVGDTLHLSAAAHDGDGDPLTFTWSASLGSLSASGDSATWTAPDTSGTATLTLVVNDGTGLSATATASVEVRLARYGGAMPAVMTAPRRVSVAPGGELHVIDAASGRLTLLTPRGEVKGVFSVPEVALSVTPCWGELLVATQSGRIYRLTLQGRPAGELSLSQGPAAWPSALACDAVRGLLYIAERDAGRVRAVWRDGSTAFAHTTTGATELVAPMDLAIDPALRRLWVLIESPQGSTTMQVHGYTLDGNYAGSMAPFGAGPGRVTRGAGLAVGADGRLYVADAFQSVVQIYDPTGTPLGELGTFGTGAGELQQPSGLALTARGDLVVANTGGARLEIFGSGQPLPACAGDADCDGLPDAWELANGFNPNDPRDALADVDGDGLTNAQEYALGTSPRGRDSDKDRYSDGEELLAGLNPLDPLDHRPVLVELSTTESDPGLVRLDSQLQGRGFCRVRWTQVAGQRVVLRDASSATPGFVERRPGTYRFAGTPQCDRLTGSPTTVSAIVRDTAPRAEAGRLAVVKAGEAFTLDATSSWDPNDGAVRYTWDQVLGPPRLSPTAAAEPQVRAWGPGLYSFQLTAQDAAGHTNTAEVPVLVVDPTRPAPTVMAVSPVQGQVGEALLLDASESSGAPGAVLTFAWRQLEGPAAALQPGPLASQRTFVPTTAGHYRFEVSATEGLQTAPWQPIDVYVAASAAGLPVAATPPSRSGVVGEPLTLSGVQSHGVGLGAQLSYRWRQVSGPAAGLTNTTLESATVVPFAPGLAVFELIVTEGELESLPARVTVESSAPGRARPVATAEGPAVTTALLEVVLDGSASTSGGPSPLRFRWTQVAGPWVALDDARGALAAFTPRLPGLYVFELEVDDGKTRSAPASVGVLVFPASSAGGRP